jgi:hypothetical protein
VSIAAALDTLTEALEAAGLRVALRPGDITPPVVYIRIGSGTDTGGPLENARVATFYAYAIPVRGAESTLGDAAMLDTVYQALTPITWEALPFTNSSVTVGTDTWPCYRFDVALAGIPASSER